MQFCLGITKNKINPKNLKGSVIFIPMVNIPAFQAQKRCNPLDNKNLNRLFPGDSSGENSEKIAFFVFEQANKIANIIVDLHSGGERWVVPFYVLVPREDTVTHINSLELAKFIDCPTI